jgi:RNA polymerase sigma-70 factor (ECF subfamily)
MRELVARHAGRLHACAERLLGDPWQAEDVVQDVFVRLMRYGGTFRHDANLGTWLYAIAVNRCRTLLASRDRDAPVRTSLTEVVADSSPGPQERLEAVSRSEVIDRALAALPDEMREAVVLRFGGGRTYEEIADIQGCAPGTVASRLHRALQRLGDDLTRAGFTRENL